MLGKTVVAFCDDEQTVRARYRAMLEAIPLQDELVVREYSNGTELVFELTDPTDHPDILYLDINMPGLDGIGAAKKLREKLNYQGAIVFLTVDKSRVFDAFDVNAVYYLVKKEFDQQKFRDVFDRARSYVKHNVEKRCAVFSCGGEDRVVPIDDIRYFEVVGHIMRVHYGNDQTFEFYCSMSSLVEQLQGSGFVRTHRNFIVSLNDIESLTTQAVTTFEGVEIPVSRSYSTSVRQAFDAMQRSAQNKAL